MTNQNNVTSELPKDQFKLLKKLNRIAITMLRLEKGEEKSNAWYSRNVAVSEQLTLLNLG